VLALVPYVLAHPGVTITELAERFEVSPPELERDLELLPLCGLPPYTADRLMDVWVVDGAVHIPLMELPQRLGEVPPDGQTLVVCKIGGRSAQAVGYLVQQGIDAVNLAGGMIEWAEAGRPMVTERGGPPQVV